MSDLCRKKLQMMLMLPFVLVGSVFVVCKMLNFSVVAISKYKVMLTELDQITPPESDLLEGEGRGYQTYRAFGRKDYRSEHSRGAVSSFYIRQFESSGWWSTQKSDGSVSFCKKGSLFSLSFADVPKTRYSIGFVLDGDSTSAVARSDCR
ncbi:hypothetical protein [Pseudomonas sp. NPDC089734]|uniref:hypothetical protein n=1 Tax=Pseudomonas sp. NPDC089734 TaxID=3364469 RepID=UPI003829774D